MLLGRLSPGLDFTTDARPERVQEIVRPWADAVWDTGIEFGTVGVGKSDHRMEITTFRADSYDRVSRHPEVMSRRLPSRATWSAATSPRTQWLCASPPLGRANS